LVGAGRGRVLLCRAEDGIRVFHVTGVQTCALPILPTMPYLLLGRAADPSSQALKAAIDEGVARIADGAEPALLDDELAQLREHQIGRASCRGRGRDSGGAGTRRDTGPVTAA